LRPTKPIHIFSTVTTAPNANLSFGTSINTNKIYLYDGPGGGKYGFGIAGGTLQVYAGADLTTNKIAFGYYNGTTFTENVRFQNNGNVGIGTTSPAAPLEVSSNGDIPFFQINTTATTNSRGRINFSQNATLGMEIGTDYTMGNITDMYIYNRATGSTAAYFYPGNTVWLSARAISTDLHLNSAGTVTMGSLSGTGNRPVFADASGDLTAAVSMPKSTQVWNQVSNVPAASSFTTSGGTVTIIASGSGYKNSTGVIGMNILVDGVVKGACQSYTNETASHKAFTMNALVITGLSAASHTLQFTLQSGTITDSNDFFSATVIETPY
jgi:hypothetical protein